MGRSQRHQLLEQNTTSAGEIHAQGAVAPGIAMQVDPEELNVTMPGPAAAPYVAGQDFREEDELNVEVPIGEYGGPLKGSSLTGAIPEAAIPPEPPEPVDEAPVLVTIAPSTSPIQSGDVTVTITGSGFTDTSVLVWNGADDTCQFVDEATLTTTVKTDLSTVPSVCTVAVRNGDQVSNELSFVLEEEAEEPLEEPLEEEEFPERIYPIGPALIGMVTDHDDGLEIGLIDTIDIRVGDSVTIEATGNTGVNGSYTVLEINPIVVDNDVVLETPIENKGRLTVLAGA